MYTAPDEQYYYPSKVCVKHHVLSNNFSVGSESPALLAAQTAQGFTGGHDRNAFDLSECEHVFLVAGDDQVGLPSDGHSQNRVVLGIGRQVYARRLVKDKGTRAHVLDNGRRFNGVEKILQTGPGENIGYLGHLRSGRYKLDLAA